MCVSVLLRGLPVAQALVESLVPRVKALKEVGVTPTLALLRVGERDDDVAYERGAKKRCAMAGVAIRNVTLPADCTQDELLEAITRINADDTIHGCLMFRPLPHNLDETSACAVIAAHKDVDCATERSLYGVFAGQDVGFAPCTAEACICLLDHYGYELEGAKACVVGRSLVIGKPVSCMLQQRNATVTMCHTRTRDLPRECREADILVVAAGHARTIGAQHVTEDQVVVDVGINWDDAASKLCGDVAFDEVEPIVGAITPVPGGVGSVTTAVLARHVVEAAERATRA